jgi:hypothetical protein
MKPHRIAVTSTEAVPKERAQSIEADKPAA